MFKIFVIVDKYQHFKSFIRQTTFTVSSLNIHQAMLKIRLLVISKLLTISSNCGLWSSASHHSTVQPLIWNEMNSDANIARHLSTGAIMVNG